jgi:hypothetical protein
MEDEEKKEPEVTEENSITRFDDRRKELINIKTEVKETELGTLKVRSEGIYHEEGIKKVLGDLEKQKSTFEKNIEILKERVAPAPEMTNDLKELEEKLQKLNLINYKKRIDEKGIKKDQDELNLQEENLKKVNKDIKEIREAIGTRLNFK